MRNQCFLKARIHGGPDPLQNIVEGISLVIKSAHFILPVVEFKLSIRVSLIRCIFRGLESTWAGVVNAQRGLANIWIPTVLAWGVVDLQILDQNRRVAISL